jgi:hypothetical protein
MQWSSMGTGSRNAAAQAWPRLKIPFRAMYRLHPEMVRFEPFFEATQTSAAACEKLCLRMAIK